MSCCQCIGPVVGDYPTIHLPLTCTTCDRPTDRPAIVRCECCQALTRPDHIAERECLACLAFPGDSYGLPDAMADRFAEMVRNDVPEWMP